jgi:hypothetical protein
MELNIQLIADEKIKAMHESGQIREQIEKGIEKTILNAIDAAVGDYGIRRNIEKQVAESVSAVVADIGFTAYNGFISAAVKRISEDVMRDDVSQKIQKVFDDLLIAKHDGIKLSEIFDAYRKWVCEATEESEKWEIREFVCDLDEKDDGCFTIYNVKFNDKKLDAYERPQIEFSLLKYRDNKTASVSALRIDGKFVDGSLYLGTLDEVQALLANLYFNKTAVVLDVDDVDDSNSYDIDD